MAIATGVIDEAGAAALRTRLDLPTQGWGTTGDDGAPHPILTHVQGMAGEEGRAKGAQHPGQACPCGHGETQVVRSSRSSGEVVPVRCA